MHLWIFTSILIWRQSFQKEVRTDISFWGYMAGERNTWKRRLSEYLMSSEGSYINFDLIDNKKSRNTLMNLFEQNYFEGTYDKLQAEEHVRGDKKKHHQLQLLRPMKTKSKNSIYVIML